MNFCANKWDTVGDHAFYLYCRRNFRWSAPPSQFHESVVASSMATLRACLQALPVFWEENLLMFMTHRGYCPIHHLSLQRISSTLEWEDFKLFSADTWAMTTHETSNRTSISYRHLKWIVSAVRDVYIYRHIAVWPISSNGAVLLVSIRRKIAGILSRITKYTRTPCRKLRCCSAMVIVHVSKVAPRIHS